MHFVDDIDLVARLHGRIAHPVQELAHLVDLGAGGGVEFQHVHVPAFDDGAAVLALGRQVDAGLVHLVGLIVQGPRQQAGGGGLADPAHAGEHEGVGDAAGSEGVLQGADHGLLADQVLEGARAVLARQHDVGVAGRRRRSVAEHVQGVGIGALRLGCLWFEREVGVGHKLPAGEVGGGWQRPEANSLRLLPSGPDRVGEGYARRQSPSPISPAPPSEARAVRLWRKIEPRTSRLAGAVQFLR